MPLLVRDRIRGHADAYLHLFERLFVTKNNSGNNFRRRAVETVSHRLHAREVLANQLDEAIVIQMPGGCDNHVAWSEALAVELMHRRPFETPHGIAGSQDRTAQWMVFPKILREDFVDEVVGIVLVHLDFFQNNPALASDV